jgi:hypothetical protein
MMLRKSLISSSTALRPPHFIDGATFLAADALPLPATAIKSKA